MLLATGLTDALPPVAGIDSLWGSAVHHCPHCHGREVSGGNIAVLASANLAMSAHQALLLRRYSDLVTVYPNGGEFDEATLAHYRNLGIAVDVRTVSRVDAGPGGRPSAVVLFEDGSTVQHDAVFVAPAMVPRDGVVRDLGLDRSPDGVWITVGPTGRTSLPGLWVAGNISNPRAQVITAAGEGSAAATDMTGFLLERDLGRAAEGLDGAWFANGDVANASVRAV